MAIDILVNPDRKLRPEGAIRCDVAWKLFDPDHIGDFRQESLKRMSRFTQWLWTEMSTRAGYMRPDRPERIFLITPDLTDSAQVYILRIVSFWDTTVRVWHHPVSMDELDGLAENLWTPPMYNLNNNRKPDFAQTSLTESDSSGQTFFMSPLTGYSHAFMRLYIINPGHTYSRHHSHTAREEHYLILSGKGTVRIADREVNVVEGDMIFKPTGPDLPTQFLATEGPMRVLDIEIWNDLARNDKDVVSYPDHNEICLFGSGWYSTLPLDSMISAKDTMDNYETGYVRKGDGTWEEKDIPGFKPRIGEKKL